MSMWLSIARVSAAVFEQISEEPSLIEAIFFDSGADAGARLGLGPDDSGGVDYLSAAGALSAMAEAMGEPETEDDEAILDLSVSGALAYEAGYGSAFFIAPADVAAAGHSIICHMDDRVRRLIERAAAGQDYLIGLVS